MEVGNEKEVPVENTDFLQYLTGFGNKATGKESSSGFGEMFGINSQPIETKFVNPDEKTETSTLGVLGW